MGVKTFCFFADAFTSEDQHLQEPPRAKVNLTPSGPFKMQGSIWGGLLDLKSASFCELSVIFLISSPTRLGP